MRTFPSILLIVFSPILLLLIGFGIGILADVAGNAWALAATVCLAATTISLALGTDLREFHEQLKNA